MKRKTTFIATSMLALLCAVPALAADLPSIKAPPIAPPPAFTWTGFYIGMSFGHTWAGSDPMNFSTLNVFDNTVNSRFGAASMLGGTNTISARLNGFLSGVQAGYNWQLTDRFVVGLEADVTGAGVRGGGGFYNGVTAGANGLAVTGVKLNRNLEYLGTVRGRLGYAVTPNILAYVTGGLAFGGANQSASMLQTLQPSLLLSASTKGNQFENLVGWTIGAGGEMALTRALSTKLEYLYYDLGNMSLSGNGLPPLAFSGLLGATRLIDVSQAQTRINGHLLRLGLNYRFDWSVPDSASGATPLFASPHFETIPAPAFGDWRFKVMLPYMWALGPNGSLTARGTTVGADASFIDGITQTSSFPLLFAGRVEARNGPLGLYADYAWFQARFAASSLTLRSPALDASYAVNSAARLKQTMAFGEAGVSYEVTRLKLGNSGATTAVDVYAGARYAYVGIDLRLDLIGAANSDLLGIQTVGGQTVARSGGIRWVDPLVGVGFRHQLSPTDEFQLRGDIGGFGVGSKFSWQGYAGYNHDFDYAGMKFTSTIGYRALAIDYSSGWGRWQNGVNAIFHGPLTGVALRF